MSSASQACQQLGREKNKLKDRLEQSKLFNKDKPGHGLEVLFGHMYLSVSVFLSTVVTYTGSILHVQSASNAHTSVKTFFFTCNHRKSTLLDKGACITSRQY